MELPSPHPQEEEVKKEEEKPVKKEEKKEEEEIVMRAIVERINSSMNDLLCKKDEEEKAEEKKEEKKEVKKAEEKKEVKKAEEKKAEETKPSQPPLKEFTVTDNGVTMHLSLWREEQTCVVSVSRSGAYKSFSELYDCETSVKVKCRQSRFFVPTELQVDEEELQHTIICVAERCWTEA